MLHALCHMVPEAGALLGIAPIRWVFSTTKPYWPAPPKPPKEHWTYTHGGTVRADVHFISSPSQAAAFVTGHASNGWTQWKTKEGTPIDQFRAHDD